MKKLLILFLFAGWSTALFAEYISRYEVNLTVQQSGELHIVETIHYDFDGASKHGIFRDIPSTVKGSGRAKSIGLYDFSIQMDGAKAEWKKSKINSSDAGELIRLKIGSPSRLITDKHIYTITYKVKNGVLPSSGNTSQDAIRWNLIGTGWPVLILKSVSTINLPVSVPQSETTVDTFAGPHGSIQKGPIPLWIDSQHLQIQTSLFEPHNGLTVEISYPIGLLDQTGAQLMAETPAERILGNWHWPVFIGFILYLFHFLSNHRGFIDERSIAPRYNAPEGISVLQSGLIYDKFTDNEDYAAAVLELAQQGYLEIYHEEDDDEPFLKRTGKKTEDLSEDMRYLMNRVLFAGKRTHLLKKNSASEASHLKSGFKTINTLLYNWSVTEGYMRENPQKIRKKFLIRAALLIVPIITLTLYTLFVLYGIEYMMIFLFNMIFIVVGVTIMMSNRAIGQKIMGSIFALFGVVPLLVTLGSSFSLTSLITSPIAAVALMGIATYYIYRRVGAYTKKGAYTHKQLLGLKEFMSRVKEDEIKRRLKEDPLYLDKAIPYAVLFGITKHWLKLYETVGAAYPLWYHGSYHNLGNFSSGMNSAATAPSSSSSG
ncbi:MAG: DUF2207 domain-containing protein, partial [Campylobacterota bacterium]|nr:DUF2207 domain-containing protein [Campylobacterota bacterium]